CAFVVVAENDEGNVDHPVEAFSADLAELLRRRSHAGEDHPQIHLPVQRQEFTIGDLGGDRGILVQTMAACLLGEELAIDAAIEEHAPPCRGIRFVERVVVERVRGAPNVEIGDLPAANGGYSRRPGGGGGGRFWRCRCGVASRPRLPGASQGQERQGRQHGAIVVLGGSSHRIWGSYRGPPAAKKRSSLVPRRSPGSSTSGGGKRQTRD